MDRAALSVVGTDCCVHMMQFLLIGRIYLWALFGPVHVDDAHEQVRTWPMIGRKVTLIVIRAV